MSQRRKTHLTPHEARVLEFVLDGRSNGEIADATGTTKAAVSSAVYKICIFYGVQGERQLLKLLRLSPNIPTHLAIP